LKSALMAPAGATIHRCAAGLGLVLLGGLVLLLALGSPSHSRAATPAVSVFPIAGAQVAAPQTQITFRGVSPGHIGSVSVTGTKSGAHAGRIAGDSDGQGGSFIPAKPFTPGERVTVRTHLNILDGRGGSFTFTVASPAGSIRGRIPTTARRVRGDVSRFVSRRDLRPATVRVDHLPRHTAPGYLFVAPQSGPVQNGPEILGPYGGLIWFQRVPKGEQATDFRVQSYRGKPVLTWWQGVVTSAGTGTGQDEIYSSAYRPVATVHAGNGLSSDLHEFQLTAQNTALVTAYYPVYWTTGKGKSARRRIVLDAVAQEIDIPTGLVLYQWDSLDHVGTTESHVPAPHMKGHPWDYFHINSIQQVGDGSLIISSRNTWAVYDISHTTGKISWQVGGKRSTFRLSRDAVFAFQHHVRLRPNNQLTVFDDGAGPPAVHRQSRGLTLSLNFKSKRVTVIRQEAHRPRLLAFFEGSDQPLPGGDTMIGWGEQPYLSEFNSRGRIDFDAHFVGHTYSYRAFRSRWNAQPAAPPNVGARRSRRRAVVYASWNGATGVNRWRVLGGSDPSHLHTVGGARRRNFETAIRLKRAEPYVAVQAISRAGKVLGTSKVIKG
jgi:hypothetical protein